MCKLQMPVVAFAVETQKMIALVAFTATNDFFATFSTMSGANAAKKQLEKYGYTVTLYHE